MSATNNLGMVNNFTVEFSACYCVTVACKPTLAIDVVGFCLLIFTLAPLPLGFEACTAEALCDLKVNKSKEAIINKLDESIGSVFQAAQKTNPNVNKENFGVPGCCWSPSVILRTLKSEGKPFDFLKVPRDKWLKLRC